LRQFATRLLTTRDERPEHGQFIAFRQIFDLMTNASPMCFMQFRKRPAKIQGVSCAFDAVLHRARLL
jgi:hypothetical protein